MKKERSQKLLSCSFVTTCGVDLSHLPFLIHSTKTISTVKATIVVQRPLQALMPALDLRIHSDRRRGRDRRVAAEKYNTR